MNGEANVRLPVENNMTDDLSLLKSAAIAIGGEYIPAHEGYCLSLGGGGLMVWNPLVDDGDCARLEAACAIDVKWWSDAVEATAWRDRREQTYAFERYRPNDDRNATRRRASVRAAAALGAAMEGKQ